MRILKFVGAIVGTLLLIFLLSFGFNLDALVTLFENREDLQEGQEWVTNMGSLKGLTEYIGEQPDKVSVVSHSIVNPDSSIRYAGDTPRSMGTISNFFLLATYARQVDEGALDPDELVPVAEIDRYQLPYIDASNHDDAIAGLHEENNVTATNEVRLQHLVQAAVIYNDLAISDFLLHKIGDEALSKTYQMLQLNSTDLPLPFSGLYISFHPALSDTSFDAHFRQLQNLAKKDFREQVLTLTDRYLNDSSFRTKVRATFEEHNGLGINFTQQRDLLSLFPKSTAGELAELMRKVQEGTLLSQEVSEQVRRVMDWPFQRQSLNSDFNQYGALYDSRLGMLNGIDYGASTYSNEPFAQAVMFDSLQVAVWFHMSSNLMHQDYQQRLIWDPALRETTLQEITK